MILEVKKNKQLYSIKVSIVRGFFFLVLSGLLLVSCSQSEDAEGQTQVREYIKIKGGTQGTFFEVTYYDSLQRDFSESIDSLLIAFDNSLSTYNSSSLITEFNYYHTVELDSSFLQVYLLAKQVHESTGGAFNPALFPLINAWGFGADTHEAPPTKTEIDSLLKRISFRDIELKKDKCGVHRRRNCFLLKSKDSIQIDFNAIAQGYSVDLLADFLDQKGIKNHYVNIGGEVKVKGVNNKGQCWRIGIEKPINNLEANHNNLQSIIELKNTSQATSGNYRKYYEKGGMKYSHTIDPVTGKPVNHSLLSATVVTESCALADAYATAFLVMGLEKTIQFINENQDLNLHVYLIYDDNGEFKTFVSDKLEMNLEEV